MSRGETLKSACRQSLGWLSTPGCRSVTGNGLDKPNREPTMTTTLERPADSAGTLYRRTDISPEDFFQSLGRVRRTVRDEIERLIDWLDSTIDTDVDSAVDDGLCDGDPDMEPSLGSFDRMSDQVKAWQTTALCTADIDAELDRCDAEPALAAPELHAADSQEHWARGAGDDREGDPGCDDREPDVDDEPTEDEEPAFGWNDDEAARGRYPTMMGHRVEHEGQS
jgi:hypothetical protein